MNERDLTRVRAHERKPARARAPREEESKAATAATFALRTAGKQHDAEKYAQALAGVLRRWCEDCALDVARRMVVILGGSP